MSDGARRKGPAATASGGSDVVDEPLVTMDPDLARVLQSDDVSRARVEAVVFGPVSDVLRNHLVTEAYVDLSNAMARLLGPDDANWCTLAVWPSFTVGETIRAGRYTGFKKLAALLPLPDAVRTWLRESAERDLPYSKGLVNRSLAAGNRGVFYEVGLAWVDFIETFEHDPGRLDAWLDFESFGQRVMTLPLPPGRVWPQGRREQLRDGFAAYLEALQTDDRDRRAQLVLLGNLRIGDHEQRRLQGWLDLAATSYIRPVTGLVARLPFTDGLVEAVERGWNNVLTRRVYVVQMADERLPVGEPVPPHATAGGRLFPPPLATLDPDVAQEFERLDRASPGWDGAEYWTDIDNRMAYIANLFRARQRAGLVGINPFSPAELASLEDQVEAAGRPRTGTPEANLLFTDVTTDVPRPWGTEVDARFRASLDAARGRCDQPADQVVEDFYATSDRPREQAFYTDVMAAAVTSRAEGSGGLATFLASGPELPPWADREQIERAQRFYAGFRSAAHLGLFYGAMPLSYAASHGCQVLGLLSTLNPTTDRDTGDTIRRFWESTRFVEDVFTTPFWEPGSDGYASISGVRLFHAAVRHTIEADSVHITHRPPDADGRVWNPAWGRPINQEDLLAGTLDWAVATIHVMDRFAVPLDPEDARAYLHTWLVVGSMLGVDPELLTSPADPERPLTLEEAQYAAATMLYRQLAPTTAGRRLMDGLLALVDEWFPGPTRRLPRAMMHTALSEDIARILGLPPAGWPERAFAWFCGHGRRWRRNRAYAFMARRVVRLVGEAWLRWWEREYREVPPYRRGGLEAVRLRMPVAVRLSIELQGGVGDLPDRLAEVDEVRVGLVRTGGAPTSPAGDVVLFDHEPGAPSGDLPADPADDGPVDRARLTRGPADEAPVAAAAAPTTPTPVPSGPAPTNTYEIEVSSDLAPSLGETLRRMRDGVDRLEGVQQARLYIDDRPVSLGDLSDAEIDALVRRLLEADR